MLETQEKAARTEARQEQKISPVQSAAFSLLGLIKSTVFCAALIVGVLLTLEWLFALGHIGEDTVVKPDQLLGYSHLANQNLCYRQEGYSRSRTNSLGFREREFNIAKEPARTRICVLGDSMTVGMEVDPKFTYTRQLENALNEQTYGKFEVLNCAMSGYGTGQEFLLYKQRVQQLNPDMVVLSYNIGDAEDNVFQRKGTNPSTPIFRVEQGSLRADLQSVNEWFATNDARFYCSFEWLRRNSRILAVMSKLNLDLSNSDATYKLVLKTVGVPLGQLWNRVLASLPAIPPASIAPELITTNFADPAKYETEKEKILSLSIPAPATTPANDATQELRRAFAVTRSATEVSLGIIRCLSNECKKNNCKLVVVSGPALTNSMFYLRELRAIKALSKQEQFTFIEANKTFPPREPMQKSPYFYGLHFTKSGHKVMSKAIYFGIKDQLLQ